MVEMCKQKFNHLQESLRYSTNSQSCERRNTKGECLGSRPSIDSFIGK